MFSLGLTWNSEQVRPADAQAIAGLIASFQSELTDDPSGAGAEEYLASVSVQAEREYLASERYRYILAHSDSQLAGVIAIRDGSHLFHLFVERSHQRQGIGRRLWERALAELCASGSDGGFTVNSSLCAVPVYQAFGFVPAGSIQKMHGISFLPMRRPAPSTGTEEQRGEALNSMTGQHHGKH